MLAPDEDGAAPAWTPQALTVLIETAGRWPHIARCQLSPLLRDQPHLGLIAGGAALARLADLPDVDLGRREEALVATADAVEIRRRLAGVNPAAFEPDLARGLWSFAWVRVAGQVELPEALNAAEESVVIYERLVERLPQAFTSDLRGALATLADVFDGLGRSEEAAQARHRIDHLEGE